MRAGVGRMLGDRFGGGSFSQEARDRLSRARHKPVMHNTVIDASSARARPKVPTIFCQAPGVCAYTSPTTDGKLSLGIRVRERELATGNETGAGGNITRSSCGQCGADSWQCRRALLGHPPGVAPLRQEEP